MSGVMIRLAEPADVPAIERLVHDAYSKYIERLGKPPGPMLDDYTEHVRHGSAWVLDEDGLPAGVIVMKFDAEHVLVDNVAIHPDRQGRGFGRQLLVFAEVEARRRGFRELRLYTNIVMHENIALYGRCGWVEYARSEQAGYHRVFMQKTVGVAI